MKHSTLSPLQTSIAVALAVIVMIGGVLFSKKDSTENWKTYADPASGISFKYPSGWKGSALTSIFSVDKKVVGMISGHDLRDPQSGIFISLFPRNFPAFGTSTMLNKEPINQDWDKNQFAKNMGISPDDLFILKNMSPHSTLVGIYEHAACPSVLRLAVLRPLHGQYSNFEVDIHQRFYEDLSIISAQKSMKDKGLDSCVLALPYRGLTHSIIAGKYSPVLDKKIQTAVTIADSVEESK